MKLLGIPNQIEKPIVKANGISIASVAIEQQVGEIAQCSFQVPPEFAGEFSSYGEVVTVTVKSESATGVIFKGKISGQGFSNMTGSISCRVDLVHEVASQLDASSTLFPGNMIGSSSDNEAYIRKIRKGGSNAIGSCPTLVGLTLNSNFGEDIKTFLRQYTESAAVSSTQLKQPGEVSKVMDALNKLWSFTGQIDHAGRVESGLCQSINSILQAGSTSTTFWNVLSQFFSEVDLVMVCKSNGELMLLPNYAGIKDDGNHVIPSDWVVYFDQSARYERTPKEVNVLVSDTMPAGGSQANQTVPQFVGHAEMANAPASASGVLNVEPPVFLRSMQTFLRGEEMKPVMNSYAKVIGTRSVGQFLMCNVVCPLILDIFPGVPASFEHMSKIKTFKGDSITSFNKKFDGYVYKISHEIATDGYPKTKFSMSNVTDGSFDKEDKHPLWTGAIMPPW